MAKVKSLKSAGWKLILLIVLAVLVFLWLIKAPILSSYLSKTLRMPVTIGWVGIWPHHTKIHNFKIRNPRGFESRVAFSANSTVIDYQLGDLFGTPTQIDQIELDNIYLCVEFSSKFGGKNNWTVIGNRMKQQTSSQRVIINKLILTNLRIEVHNLGLFGKPIVKIVDRLEFDNIDSEKGFPTEELIKKVFGGSGIQNFLQDAFKPIQDILSPLKLF